MTGEYYQKVVKKFLCTIGKYNKILFEKAKMGDVTISFFFPTFCLSFIMKIINKFTVSNIYHYCIVTWYISRSTIYLLRNHTYHLYRNHSIFEHFCTKKKEHKKKIFAFACLYSVNRRFWQREGHKIHCTKQIVIDKKSRSRWLLMNAFMRIKVLLPNR